MNPLMQLLALTGVPFVIGILVGFGLRAYISLVRRAKGALH
jgi:hypothetical protein